ncbi:MAG: hypothetical protein ACP5IB_09470 [Thermoplasmata archaeon]
MNLIYGFMNIDVELLERKRNLIANPYKSIIAMKMFKTQNYSLNIL